VACALTAIFLISQSDKSRLISNSRAGKIDQKKSTSRIGVIENPVLGELFSQLALTITSDPEADDNPAKADLRFLINVMIFLPSTTTCRGMARYFSLTEYA